MHSVPRAPALRGRAHWLLASDAPPVQKGGRLIARLRTMETSADCSPGTSSTPPMAPPEEVPDNVFNPPPVGTMAKGDAAGGSLTGS